MVFYPIKELNTNPSNIGLEYENVYLITTDNIRIHGWFIPDNSTSKTILFFHGNAGNISHRLEIIDIFSKLKVNIFIIDYRGYGNSTDKPSEKGMYTDAITAYEYLINQKKINSENIIVYGKSLGTVPAIDLASRVKTGRLIIDSGLT